MMTTKSADGTVVPLREWQIVEARHLPDNILAEELRSRGAIVVMPAYYDKATGLIRQEGKYFTAEAPFEEVGTGEAYTRATKGW